MNKEHTIYYTFMNSPHGNLLIAKDTVGITHINFQDGESPIHPQDFWLNDETLFCDAITQLEAYFYGELCNFNLPLNPKGTEFQQQVWKRLCAIPCGETLSYQDLANQLGQPTANRAVASANGQNPIAIVIPCHRIIGSDGHLRGYAGGLDIKAALLALERTKADVHGGQMYLG